MNQPSKAATAIGLDILQKAQERNEDNPEFLAEPLKTSLNGQIGDLVEGMRGKVLLFNQIEK
jgi:hypothetical protein